MNFLRDIYRDSKKALPFLLSLLASGVAYGLYRGVQDNYLVEVLSVTPFERGIIEFFRELPGLMVVFVLALMWKFSESKIFKAGTAIMLLGVTGLLLAPSIKVPVIMCMVLFSLGEHIIMPVKSSISLEIAKEGKGGRSLGITSTIGSLGNIAGYLIVTLIFALFMKHAGSVPSVKGSATSAAVRAAVSTTPFRVVFAASLFLMALALVIALSMKEASGASTKRRRFYFAKKFSTYYILEVFYGARKQIFLTFAPLVLIRIYGADTALIAFLLALCAIASFVLSPFIGRIIDKLGYKTVMIFDTLILVIVCMLYGFSHRLFAPRTAYIVVCANYLLDSVISLASMASSVYVKDIADSQEEVTATISTGISVNHAISIFIALFGGYLWSVAGIETLFTLSAVLGIINSIYAATIKVKGRGKVDG